MLVEINQRRTCQRRLVLAVHLILTGRAFQLERDMGKQPRDEWLTINGLNFHYRDWGGGEPGIILLHGLASTYHIWDQVAPPSVDLNTPHP